MLMSIRSAPIDATVAAAERITSESAPNSWIAIGPPARSRGSIRRSSVQVFALRWWIAKLDTISETTRPAPNRRACRRTNQLPIPASGASTTRLGSSSGPIDSGSVSAGISPG